MSGITRKSGRQFKHFEKKMDRNPAGEDAEEGAKEYEDSGLYDRLE